MFTSSYDRARELARAALSLRKPIAVIAAYRSPHWQISGRAGQGRTSAFGLLRKMGVATTSRKATWMSHFYPKAHVDEKDEPCEHRALPVTWDKADILLWNNIAQDIGIEPKAPVLSKLADVDLGVVVDAYDDRGMDVVALSPEPIQHLHQRFNTWLLDYDRERMSKVFSRSY